MSNLRPLTADQKHLRALWIEALRSGRFRQGTGYLRKGDAYCCLGVLCEVFDPHGWVALDDHVRDGIMRHRGGSATMYLTPKLREAVGLTFEQMTILMRMNDEEHASFEGIADKIARLD